MSGSPSVSFCSFIISPLIFLYCYVRAYCYVPGVRLAEIHSRTRSRTPAHKNEQHGYGKKKKSLFMKGHRTQSHVNSKYINVDRIRGSRDTFERSDD